MIYHNIPPAISWYAQGRHMDRRKKTYRHYVLSIIRYSMVRIVELYSVPPYKHLYYLNYGYVHCSSITGPFDSVEEAMRWFIMLGR
jgi:hypothetical protein